MSDKKAIAAAALRDFLAAPSTIPDGVNKWAQAKRDAAAANAETDN